MGNNDEYAKKLKARREAEQKKLLEKRKSRNPILTKARELRSRVVYDLTEKDKSIEKTKSDEDISPDDVEKVIQDSPVEKVDTKLTEAPPNETDEEKQSRLIKVRKEIYEKHKQAIDVKYQEGRQTILESQKQEIEEINTEHQETLDGFKEELDEGLEEYDDPQDRREVRQTYNENIKEEKELHNDNIKEKKEEHSASLKELDEEFQTKLDTLLEAYNQDVDAIKDGTYTEEELELCNTEFERETISFDSLEEYETDDDNESYSGGYGYRDSFNPFRLVIPAIGLGVVGMVGWQVLSVVTETLETSQQYNTTSMNGVSSIVSGFPSGIVTILLFAPLVLIILPMMFRMMRGFDRL